MILPIRLYGDPILRRQTAPVKRFDAELKRLVDDMIETVYAADGIGLAAPQVGVPLSIFVALEAARDESDDAAEDHEASEEDETQAPQTRDQKRRAWGVIREHVMINPRITERRGQQHGRDGCLSLPGLVVEDVPRDLAVRVEYLDVNGEPQVLTAEGYFAHVIQHEYDHLRGVLFFDHLSEDVRRAFLESNRAELSSMQREAKERLKAKPAGRTG
ncbi:MAG: peptide deformylase [Trueperaceae bacterium]|nr:peptide deformylase [Trueperaceae bacterium]